MNSYLKPIQFFFIFLIGMSICFLTSCINEKDKKEIEKSAAVFDIKQGEASIKQSNQRFMKAFEASDSTEASNCYSLKGKLMLADKEAITGRDKIETYLGKMMALGVKKFELKTLQIWGDSTILAEEGTYEMSDSGNNQLDKGKYIVLWKPESGNWKMYRDMWTSDLPPKIAAPQKVQKIKK